MQLSSISKAVGNFWSIFQSNHIPRHAAAILAPILVDAPTAAATLWVSEREFHSLRKRADFPRNATVVLGPRCVRFRLEALYTFALAMASTPPDEPAQPPPGDVRRLQEQRRSGPKTPKAQAVDLGATGMADSSPASGSR